MLKLEIIDALEQNIDSFVFMVRLLIVKAFRYKVEDEGRMHPMFIGRFKQELEIRSNPKPHDYPSRIEESSNQRSVLVSMASETSLSSTDN